MPILFNAVGENAQLVDVSESTKSIVYPLIGYDPATGATTMIDDDARLEDSHPRAGLVLVKSLLDSPRMRVLDLRARREVGAIPAKISTVGAFLGQDRAALIFGR